jgi:hypothetical protein
MDNGVSQQNLNATHLVHSKLTVDSECHLSRFRIILSYLRSSQKYTDYRLTWELFCVTQITAFT